MEIINILSENAVLFWVILSILMVIIESMTMGLSTIWFAIGGVCALITVFLGVSFKTQVVVFLIISLVLLLFTRKFFVEKLKVGNEKTNIDALVGKKAILIEGIIPFSTGIVKLNGQEWTAVCEDENSTIEAGNEVEVVAIKGVKAIVRQIVK